MGVAQRCPHNATEEDSAHRRTSARTHDHHCRIPLAGTRDKWVGDSTCVRSASALEAKNFSLPAVRVGGGGGRTALIHGDQQYIPLRELLFGRSQGGFG